MSRSESGSVGERRRTRKSLVGAVVAAATAALTVATTLVAITLTASPAQAAGTGTGYLRTNGNRLVDATGATVRLTGINWFGMETDNHTFHGLWANPPATWRGQIDRMADLGFNTLRIPFTGDSLRPGAQATSINSFTNPDLVGLSPLEILDRVIAHAGSRGMRVILDRHRPSAASGITALWYTPQVSEQSIINDWVMLANRYAGNTTVIGADLINEPHAEGTLPNATGSGWGQGGTARDWRLAAERIGNAVLAVQPNWLIFVEGVSCPTGGLPNEFTNPPIDDDCTWWGGNLAAAGQFPVRLNVANRLVYSAHDYAISVFDRQPWFEDPTFPNNLPAVWDHYWGYLHKQNIAPVLVGEFGSTLQNPLDRQWLPALMSYMTANGMSFTFWSWNPNSGDTGGLALDDWWTINQTKYDILRPHLVPPVGGGPSTSTPATSSPPAPTGNCSATYTLTGGWPGNFQADVRVTNSGTATISSWALGWTYAGNQDLFNWWGANITESGRNVSATNVAHNGTIAPGQSVTFGIQGTVTGTNAVPSPVSCTA
jgi:endoglucanase